MDHRSLAEQYSTSAHLAARIALHRECSVNPYGLQRWIFDRLGLRSGQRVLELGCGTQSLWRENADRVPDGLRLVLTDFSLAMQPRVACALPDVPFADETFDVVIANHMLYHVADLERALRDIRRVMRPGATFFAATNGVEHLREIRDLAGRFDIEWSDVSAAFTLENGEAQLRRVFDDVRREDYEDALRIDDPDLLLAYVASVSSRAAAIVEARREEMRAAIGEGTFPVRKSTGLFLCGGGRLRPP